MIVLHSQAQRLHLSALTSQAELKHTSAINEMLCLFPCSQCDHHANAKHAQCLQIPPASLVPGAANWKYMLQALNGKMETKGKMWIS